MVVSMMKLLAAGHQVISLSRSSNASAALSPCYNFSQAFYFVIMRKTKIKTNSSNRITNKALLALKTATREASRRFLFYI